GRYWAGRAHREPFATSGGGGAQRMPQPDGTDRPQVDWWWDGSGRGYFWVWLLGLAGVVVLFSVAVLLTAGGAPIRSVALANLESGLGVALLPTLIALRRLDRRRRLGTFGV